MRKTTGEESGDDGKFSFVYVGTGVLETIRLIIHGNKLMAQF